MYRKGIIICAVLSLWGIELWCANSDHTQLVADEKPAAPEPAPAAAENSAESHDSHLSKFMRQKLEASSKILEGLVVEDATLVKSGGESLLKMSRAETFQVLTDVQYRAHNRRFRSSVERLVAAAEGGSFDKMTLQWFDVARNCVDCHDYLREDKTR